MKKHIFAVLLGSLFLTQTPTAYSAYNFDPSGSLVSDSTMLPSGYQSYYYYVDHQRFGAAYGGQYDFNMVGGFRIGIRDKMEVGLSFPIRSNTGENAAGLIYIMAHARLHVATFNQGQQQLYLNVYRTSGEMQSIPELTSGLPNQGFYLALHNDKGRFKTRYLIGSGRADTRYYTAGVGGFAESRRTMVSAGARFGSEYNNHLWLDFIFKMDSQLGTRTTYNYVAPTLIMPKANGTRYFISVALGYPLSRAAPHTEIVMGMSYRPPRSGHVYARLPVQEQQVQTSEEPGSGDGQQQKVPTEEESQADNQVGSKQQSGDTSDMVTIEGGSNSPAMEQQMGSQDKQKPSANQCKATIEIIYFTGQKQRALALATELKAQGYCVKSVVAQDLTVLKSEIYMRSDLSKELVAEVEDISGARQHSVRQLPWGTDMQILLGKY
jgi:hypothetical protein